MESGHKAEGAEAGLTNMGLGEWTPSPCPMATRCCERGLWAAHPVSCHFRAMTVGDPT